MDLQYCKFTYSNFFTFQAWISKERYKAFNRTQGEMKAVQQLSEKMRRLRDTSVAGKYTYSCK